MVSIVIRTIMFSFSSVWIMIWRMIIIKIFIHSAPLIVNVILVFLEKS